MATTGKRTSWYCTAKIEYWDRMEGDYVTIDLDHYSRAATREEAEYDARESWSDHGYNPESVRVEVDA